ncbi:ABC transporter substrate-binding protein [Haloarchaeobius litoreus]|uniref:ABC transporter substrate-binding protein n=1 Tax=Haloarchaeobius litoreus TaxID=755306 RepID=A0ABD6DM43_9EURY|nr:ABC transporter substrate-binding protein [Haloarchaeobius litoreus]
MAIDRRRLIKYTGGLAGLTALTGCLGGDGGDGETTAPGGGDDTDTDGGGGGAGGGGGDDIRIGVLLPFSGDYAWVGANVLPVVEMLVEEINDGGGIDGRQVSIVQGDTEASPDASVSATNRLVNVENVHAVIGPTSITMSAVIDTLVENEVPVVTPTAGTTSLDDRGGEYVFRTVSSDSLGGRAIARAARDQQYNSIQDYERMALMVGNEEVFQSFKEPIQSAFEEFGGTITTAMDIRTGKASYTSEVQSMMDSDPEITVLVASVEDSIKITEAGFQAGYEGNWFATQDQTNQDFLSQSDNRVTNDMLGLNAATYQPAEEAGRLQEFFDAITEYAGWDEGSRVFATNTFDAMNVLGLAMAQVAADGDDMTGANIASAIPTVARPPEQEVTNYTDGASAIADGTDVDYQGLVGPIDFDDDGDIVAPFSIKRAQDGEWTEAGRLPPEAL